MLTPRIRRGSATSAHARFVMPPSEPQSTLNRRVFIRLAAVGSFGSLLAACGPAPQAAAPTSAPAAVPTSAPKPTSPPATSAPAATAAPVATATIQAAPAAAKPTQAAQPAPAPTQDSSKRGGTLRAFSSQTIGRIDPTSTQANYLQVLAIQLHSSLVRFKTGGTDVVADLAEKWDASADGLTYTFTMRSGRKFHDGSPIALSDVLFSLERARADTSVWKANYSKVQSIATDSSANAVVLKLSGPDPFLLQKLAAIGGSAVYSEAIVKKFGDKFATTPESSISSGPFKLTATSETEQTYERFADSHAPSNIDRISLRIIPDPNTQRLEFEAGNLDWITSVLSNDDAKRFKNDSKFAQTYKEFASPDAFWYGFNPTVKPFDDVRVRQAIAMTMDMASAVEVYGLGKPTGVLLHPSMPGYDATRAAYMHDQVKAQDLLQQVGVPTGALKLELNVWNIPAFVAMSEAIVEQLNEAGFQASMKVAEFGTFISEVRKGTYPFFINLGNISVWDPAQWLFDSFHSTGPFDVKYLNSDVDTLLSQAVAETNVTRRADLAGQAEAKILKDAVAIPIMNRIAGEVFQPWVHGVETVTPIYPNVPLNELWLDPSHR
jgi:ABC-type transport system substrate-binding protein